MKNVQLNKRMTIFGLVALIFIIIIVSVMLTQNKEMQELEASKISALTIPESTKLWVLDEVSAYLGVVDEHTWRSARTVAKMTDECLEKVYHSDFSEFGVANIGSYTITDCQYTLGDTENMDVYVEIATESNRALHFIYTLSNNTIYDVTVF